MGKLILHCNNGYIGKICIFKAKNVYQYNGIHILPLGMIGDVITVPNLKKKKKTDLNKIVNTTMDHKNLKMSKKKCFRINIGKKTSKLSRCTDAW